MPNINIGIPLNGKMAARAFHQHAFRKQVRESGFAPFFFLSPAYYRAFDFNAEQYFELRTNEYDELHKKHILLQQLRMLRRFVVQTDTTDLRLREMIETKLFDATLLGISAQLIYVSMFRRVPNIGKLLAWLESLLYKTHEHDNVFKKKDIHCVLSPGLGNYGFWHEGNFALEAQRMGIPAFSAITNYDNVVNMGYRGFTPLCLAVWSEQMADEVMRLHGFPANRLEITGPVQYDRFVQPLPLTRSEFLRSLKLDPDKKTVFYAGGVNINHYFEIYRLFVEEKERIWKKEYNFILRPQPHAKLLASPGWQVVEKLFLNAGVYVSNPGSVDASSDRTNELRQDMGMDEGVDELNYLLRYSDVLINNFSTMGLEAAICDLPTIYIGYDSYTFGVRFGVTTGFQQRMTHNRRQLRLKAAKVAKNEGELVSFIEEYLSDRTIDQESRQEYAISEIGNLDGKSTERLLKMIHSRL